LRGKKARTVSANCPKAGDDLEKEQSREQKPGQKADKLSSFRFFHLVSPEERMRGSYLVVEADKKNGK